MVWYGVESRNKKAQKVNKEKELLQKAIENMKKFLSNPKLNKRGIMMNLDNIKTRKEDYVRKDGKKTKLLIAEIPVKDGNGNKEIREYVYNRGYFQRYQG